MVKAVRELLPKLTAELVIIFVGVFVALWANSWAERRSENDVPTCEDPDDDKFLAYAKSAGVSVIVSGDKHLLEVSGWEAIDVLKPRQFGDRYLKADS